MRKVLLSSLTALALIAFSANSNQAKAGMICDYIGPVAGVAAGAASYGLGADVAAIGGGATNVATGFLVGFPAILGSFVVCDIANGGLTRKYAEVVPGAGYQARDLATAAKLTHEFNVAMGYADDAQTALYLASAVR